MSPLPSTSKLLKIVSIELPEFFIIFLSFDIASFSQFDY